jgi:hypothetical protein
MRSPLRPIRSVGLSVCALLLTLGLVLCAEHAYLYGQDKSGFSDEYEAVQAAPASHRVVFENAFIRVVHVTLPPAGSSEPMTPIVGLVYLWATTQGVRQRTFATIPPTVKFARSLARLSRFTPARGIVAIGWPGRMHSIEVVENPAPGPGGFPGWLRIEVKCTPK